MEKDTIAKKIKKHGFDFKQIKRVGDIAIFQQSKPTWPDVRYEVVKIGKHSDIEISHHYGLSRFREFGAVIIDIINRKYCKKLIIQLPRQKHPYHYHKKKEETFQILYGNLEVEVDGESMSLSQGDIATVKQTKWHKFHTLNGVIFEEISTTHYNNDSFYEDNDISTLKREDRKTIVRNWEC